MDGDRMTLRREPPRQVPSPTPHFTNQRDALALADAAAGAPTTGPHLLVFAGQPGIGKSELARFWVHRRAADYPDGHFHVDLSDAPDTAGLVSTALREFLLAVDVAPSAIPDTLDGRAACFRTWSTGRRVAVVLDGVYAPSQVRMLRPGPGRSVVLVTAVAAVAELDSHATVIDLEPLEEPFARTLLGHLARPDRLAAEPEAARELLAMCAGLPIAVCVAGALLKCRPHRLVSALVGELRDERARLSGFSQIRNKDVRAMFAAAYGRLGREARSGATVRSVRTRAAGPSPRRPCAPRCGCRRVRCPLR
ncbi:hypothetical protein BJF78_30700 [Pseudonocardia sp. CNS-139]|nr:hypothetical protein BJF78_30700 [Pseudonocardia sp. CNS-139]